MRRGVFGKREFFTLGEGRGATEIVSLWTACFCVQPMAPFALYTCGFASACARKRYCLPGRGAVQAISWKQPSSLQDALSECVFLFRLRSESVLEGDRVV
mmetsp:Transcript_9833/g.19043  ORF Transcript_9833/g.19043 Transcript_9833/m.19043 type:complete len:100 (-) Transcript_9833:2085-2384(-)